MNTTHPLARSLTLISFLVFLAGIAIPSSVRADTMTFPPLSNQNLCSTTSFGFTTGTGCAAGQTCVMSTGSTGSGVPTCMPTAATGSVVNYTSAPQCNTACGHVCTSNPNSYTGTYYCADTLNNTCTGASGTSGVCAEAGQCSSDGSSDIEDGAGVPSCGSGSVCCTSAVVSCTGGDGAQGGTCAESGSCGNNTANKNADGLSTCGSGNVCCVSSAAQAAVVNSQTQTGSGGNAPIQTGVGGNAPTQTGVGGNTGTVSLINPLAGVNCSSGNGDCLMSFLKSILAFVIRIGTIVVVFAMIYVGYMFVVAQGAPGKIEDAKRALLWTIIGALILLGAQAIASGISDTVQSLGS